MSRGNRGINVLKLINEISTERIVIVDADESDINLTMTMTIDIM